MIIGHLIQVLHALLAIVVMYFITRRSDQWWIIPISTGILIASQWLIGGCLLTVISNLAFRSAGCEEYSSWFRWMASFVGVPASHAFCILILTVPLIWGWVCKRQVKQ